MYGLPTPIRVIKPTLHGPYYSIRVEFPTLSRLYHPNMAKDATQIATT
jgi:hypothetical protein